MGDLDDQIRDLLRPLMADVQSRKARLGWAFAKFPGPLDRIAYDGETGVFLDHLIGKLYDYGEVGPGLPALAVLLESIRNDVGVGDRQRIDTILRACGRGPRTSGQARRSRRSSVTSTPWPTRPPACRPTSPPTSVGRAGAKPLRRHPPDGPGRRGPLRLGPLVRRGARSARAAGFEEDRLAYAPGAPARKNDWIRRTTATPARLLLRRSPGTSMPPPASPAPSSWATPGSARPGCSATRPGLARDGARLLRDRAGGLDALALPLLARLSDLNQTNDFLEEALAAAAGPGQSEAFRRFVLQRLETGHAVVLLDAWDEVPVEVPEPGQPIAYKPNYRQRLGQRIDGFARRFPRCRVLLTSRIVGYDGSPIPDARELELFAFDWPQIEAFAWAWFGDAEPFLAMLRQNPQVQGLARIPLMLTLMRRAHEEQRRHPAPPTEWSGAPTRRVQIYSLCLRGLLRDWKEEKERRPSATATWRRCWRCWRRPPTRCSPGATSSSARGCSGSRCGWRWGVSGPATSWPGAMPRRSSPS